MLRGPRLSPSELSLDPRAGSRTLLDALRYTAEQSPRRGLYVTDGKGHQNFRTYGQLLEGALRAGAALEKKGLGSHDRIVLVMPTGFEFVTAFFGAISIAAIPIPIAPPRDVAWDASNRAEAVLRLADRLNVPAALFSSDATAATRPPQQKNLKLVMDLSTLVQETPIGAAPEGRPSGDIAYMQPTSGATGRRRTVELTHRNILTNVDAVGRRLAVTDADIGISWLPLHSILGLVGVVLFGIYWGIDVVLMQPERFLRHPHEWLQLFARHGGTLAASPSFGYDYCVRRCQKSNLEGLDLSTWRVALNGGEPVRRDHMRAFRRRFANYGFERGVFCPVYGLTEGTLAVTFGTPGEDPAVDTVSRGTLEQEGVAEPIDPDEKPDLKLQFCAVGTPLHNIDCMIIDHRGIELPDRTLGEIAVRGPNVMRGYFDQPKKRSDGGTRLSGEWLMTGDLGYIADGELFVVARDVETFETFGSRTVFPRMLEDVIERIDGVRSGSAVAFAGQGPDGDDILLVAVELQSGAEEEEVEALIRSRLLRKFRLEPERIYCVSPQSIPRTATGKVRRHLVREFHTRDMLDRKARSDEFDGVRRIIQRSRHEVLKFGQALVQDVKKLIGRDERD